MLTRKQHQLILFINERLEATGISPSFDEMKDALDLKSKSGIHRLITALEERGFIRRLAHRARALEVLKLPGSTVARKPNSSRPTGVGFSPNVIPGNFARPAEEAGGSNTLNKEQKTIALPLYGRIAAGTPITALRDYSNTIEVPPSLLGTGDHYALEVAGDSMVEAGIFDGDTAIIQRCDTAENGAIVVALIDDDEVTLKRLRRRNHAIALEPANPLYETRIFGPDQVVVQGKLLGLLRIY